MIPNKATRHFNSMCGYRQGGGNTELKPLTLQNEEMVQDKVLSSPLNNVSVD